MIRVSVKPRMYHWARERSRLSTDTLRRRFPRLHEWEVGKAEPTLKQLEAFARATFTPVGYLFLDEPPEERVPIPDFRTIAHTPVGRPSPDLLDTIYICEQRQAWYRDFAHSSSGEALGFVGSVRTTAGIEQTAATMRKTLGFDLEERRRMGTWTEALRRFMEQAEGIGILVMCNGVVLSNNKRVLDPDEFRGFALADPFAPLVFINGADTKAGQMFTLAHELAHVWLGESGVSDSQASKVPEHVVERWCNQVAAELLVPIALLRKEYRRETPLQVEMQRLAAYFKVSSLVILRRIHDAGGLPRERMWNEYKAELERILARPRTSGGNFYLTHAVRVSKRFARALVVSTLEGHTLYRDAFRMLGLSKPETFESLGRELGVGA
jgi:Zn-dependent peptidase ImmA (M78 family)